MASNNAFASLGGDKSKFSAVVSPIPAKAGTSGTGASKTKGLTPSNVTGRNSATILASSAIFKKQFSELQTNKSTGIFSSTVQIKAPDSFDGREVWKKYLAPVRNQGNCGACWAFAATTVLQTRLAIATNGKFNLILSPAKMVLCNLGGEKEYEVAKESIDVGIPYDYNLPSQIEDKKAKEISAVSAVGCNGETMIGAWQFLYRFGVPVESCMTYEDLKDDKVDLMTVVGGETLPVCSELISDTYDVCPANKEPMELHLAEGFYHVPGVKTTDPKDPMGSGSELDIRNDIYHWGPVTSGFAVYEDFMTWDGKGVYQWDGKSAKTGGHAIVIVGWGTENGTPYWMVRNSWGPEWGDQGYFKILRGTNHCEIEENVIVGMPGLYGFRLFLEWPLLYRTEDLTLRAMWGVEPSGYKTTTFEKMALGLINPNSKLIKYQYDPATWPDVSVYIAAEKKTHVYKIADYYNPIKHPANYLSIVNRMDYLIGGVAGAVIALAGVGVFFLIRNKMKKH